VSDWYGTFNSFSAFSASLMFPSVECTVGSPNQSVPTLSRSVVGVSDSSSSQNGMDCFTSLTMYASGYGSRNCRDIPAELPSWLKKVNCSRRSVFVLRLERWKAVDKPIGPPPITITS